MDILGYIEDIQNFFRLPIWRWLIYGIVFILIIIWLAFVYWTYRDARLRNTSPTAAIFWALVVLAFSYPGLVVYLILRPPEFIDDIVERDLEISRMEALLDSKVSNCPACGKEVHDDFLICPYCRKKLKNQCISCGRPLDLDWKVCPYCKTTQ
ncbi:MAG: zinc ribbon domain-containing protein [Actinobacteria bacterium]|nr:zinc ribbon domain-containing protein [Actinomycetota bacterium]